MTQMKSIEGANSAVLYYEREVGSCVIVGNDPFRVLDLIPVAKALKVDGIQVIIPVEAQEVLASMGFVIDISYVLMRS